MASAAEDPPPEAETPGEATILVSEFPPPPFYYHDAANLTPPEIPQDALETGTRRAEAAAARARAEAERLRLADEADKTDAILGGVPSAVEEQQKDEEGDVVGVFGEIVEDPLLVNPLDICENPTVIRDEVKRLNRKVVELFISLSQELVNRPAENKKVRDQLQHHVFLMLQETNKFREHQARELLIEMLEKQLEQRKKLLEELEAEIQKTDALLGDDDLMVS